MKRIVASVLALFCFFCLIACQKEPEVDVYTEEELEEILSEIIVGGKVDFGDYSEEEEAAIKDKLDKDGFTIVPDADNDKAGTLAPKNPVSQDKLDEIVKDAQEKGEVDFGGYNEAQKEQIKDELEDAGLQVTPPSGDSSGSSTVIPVTPIPDLTEEELSDILAGFGIVEGAPLAEDFEVRADLSAYPKKQQEQIKNAAGLQGLSCEEKDGEVIFRVMAIHLDQVTDNEYE